MIHFYILEGHGYRVAGPDEPMQEAKDRRVAYTTIGETRISTVFLPIDHSFGEGPPLLFETMVFEGPLDGTMDRYTTWEAAERGHQEMVTRVQALQQR